MIRSEGTRGTAVTALSILAVTAAYYGVAQLGLLRQVTIHGARVTPLWPPTGIALSSLLYLGLRIWPGIALGSFLVVATVTGPINLAAPGIVVGNTVAPICAYLILRRVGFRMELDRLRDGVVLVFLGAMAGMLISASMGTTMLAVTGRLPFGDFWPVWAAWWAGDAMGVLIVTPVLLVMRRARLPRRTDRWAEATALAVVCVVLGLVATTSSLSMLYLTFPVLIWAALRFQLAGSAPCALVLSVLAIVAGSEKVGPFSGHTILEIMLNLAILNGSMALTALLLASIVSEDMNIRRRIEQACEELAEVVEHLAPGRSATAWPSRHRHKRDGH
ncbi:MASE1 domain-containing protein [Streptomyces sp. NBC_01320]|uniref:MASE1 domain-containing protein n=1 Tax=Streptomyces sp. NBC_01320 TaxID=2903824 RepID=UPI002E147286|nr:MASE1 domain-containing protein [Streptomyces sp. NBC_01320]